MQCKAYRNLPQAKSEKPTIRQNKALQSLAIRHSLTTRRLEKKRSVVITDDAEIAKAACAFANASGGFVVFGMKDQEEGRGFDEGVAPINRRQPVKSWIEQKIPTLLEPTLTGCEAMFIQMSRLQDGRGVLVLKVPQSDSRPHWVRG